MAADDKIKPVHIVADSRESRAGIADRLRMMPGVTVEQAELASGDYLIGSGVAVERKAASDFVISLMEGRLFDQIARMSIEHERVVVLVEGSIYDTRSAIAPEALDGALSYLSLLSCASVIYSPSLTRTPFLLYRMAHHIQHGLGYLIPSRSNKPKGPAAAQFLLEGLPQVGPSAALALLAHFGSPRQVFAASKEQLVSVKGIGPKTADAIIAALS
jgi:Fanconi anemia group M protein